MTEDLDRALATLLTREAERVGTVIPPPLDQLRQRAASRRRTRIALGALTAAAAVVVGVLVWGAVPGGHTAYVPPAGGPIAETFEVPTYEWDEDGGMQALVGGRLWFTEQDCPIMADADGPSARATAVLWPNATGVRYHNGLRAVVDGQGRVYAVEGQEFSYAGGWSEPASDQVQTVWDQLCDVTPLRDVAIINDVAGLPPLTEAPVPPSRPGPTAPSTAEELGFYPVPTFEWDPEQGSDSSLIEGTLAFTDEGCPVIETESDGQTTVTGLVIANAEGFRDPADGTTIVYVKNPDGSGIGLFEGDEVTLGGVNHEATDPRWTDICVQSPVDQVFYAYATLP